MRGHSRIKDPQISDSNGYTNVNSVVCRGNTLDDLRVGSKDFFQHGLTKGTPFRNITHQQFHNHIEFIGSLKESTSSFILLRSFTNGREKMLMSSGIVELDCTDTT